MALVRRLGMRGLGVMVLVHAMACSDDGVPATTDDPSAGSTGGTNPTDPSGTDPTGMTGTTAESTATDTSPESTGPGTTTGEDTSATTTSPTDTSGTTDSSSSDTGSTTGEPATPECAQANECEVVDDCCSCTAIPLGAEAPACDVDECKQSACAAAGVTPIAQCELGSCELAEVPCNPLDVSCDALPPVCPKGTQPGVDLDAECWTNTCVPNELCDAVSSCADCGPDEVCVEMLAHFPTVTCSPVPPECDGTPSCACMGTEVCISPFDTCNDDGPGLQCICIAC